MIDKKLRKEIREKRYAQHLRVAALFFEKVYPKCQINGRPVRDSGNDTVETDFRRMAEIFEEISKEPEEKPKVFDKLRKLFRK